MDVLNYIENSWIPPNYTELLKLFEVKHIRLFDMVLNIVLVKLGVRRATLIELNNLEDIDKKIKNVYEKILDVIIEKFNMVKTADTSYRYFVTNNKIIPPKTDEDIGKLLGFECVDHDFYLQDVPRISYSIYENVTGENLYTEVCEIDKIGDFEEMTRKQVEKVKMWNDKINGIIPYEFKLVIENILPTTDLYKRDKYTNIKYVEENLDRYLNLIFNDFNSKAQFLDEAILLSNFDKFIFIMDNIKVFETLYNIPSNIYPSEGYYRLIKNLIKFEVNLLRAKNKSRMNILLEQLKVDGGLVIGKKRSKKRTKKRSKKRTKKSAKKKSKKTI